MSKFINREKNVPGNSSICHVTGRVSVPSPPTDIVSSDIKIPKIEMIILNDVFKINMRETPDLLKF